MLVRIDPASGVPLAAQIAAQVRGAVAAGTLGPGDRLPAARDLADGLQVNMHTVLRAYGQLRDEGLIELRRGRGATVRRDEAADRARLVDAAHHLLAAARRLGLDLDELVAEVRRLA
ncbi:GntR family transcriptional regulator [Micromonospora sp. BQ11]|uniref:GntR family transcriptional regulator n=1 Tax=Micromonospora sp. BQ11 TaxID=3452212 RepID=UPI003F888918